MFLEHVDIDVFGPHHRISIGSISPGLNAVYGPAGSGKTAIVEFIRAVMLGDARWSTNTAGRLVWCNTEGLIVCRREVDGTPSGRLSMERLARDGHTIHNGGSLFGRTDQAYDYQQDAQWIDTFIVPLCEDIRQIRRSLAVADRAGFRVAGVREEHPEHQTLQARLRELESLLVGELREEGNVEELESRRRNLSDLLARASDHASDRDYDRWRDDCRRLEEDFEAARREILICEDDRRDSQRASDAVRDELHRLEHASYEPDRHYSIDQTYRRELEELDGRLIRWRRTLSEVRELREVLKERASDLRTAGHPHEVHPWGVDRPIRRSLDSVESRIEEVQRRLNWMSERYGVDYENGVSVSDRLAEVLRTARQHTDHSVQLSRCEQELLTAIENLITQRSEVLRKIADEYHVPADQLSAGFGEWRRFEDQPRLYDWLFSEACPPRPIESEAYQSRCRRLRDELAELEVELTDNSAQMDLLRREHAALDAELGRLNRHSPRRYDHSHERERWQAELVEIDHRLARGNRFGSLRRERDELLTRVRSLESHTVRVSRFSNEISAWLAQLSGGRLRNFAVENGEGSERVDQRVLESLSTEEIRLVSLAIRFAGVDSLARQGFSIPLVIDAPTLDSARRIIEHTNSSRQVVMMTAHREIADHVASRGGKLIQLQGRSQAAYVAQPHLQRQYSRTSMFDVNRELDTVWRETNGYVEHSSNGNYDNRPFTREQHYARWQDATSYIDDVPRNATYRSTANDDAERPFFLSPSSSVDQAPSVDAVVAARLRGIGIHRIGQLLSAEPDAVADRLGLAGVGGRRVQKWQAEARMVCEVPRLRPFDARVLVGCGVSNPRQLAEMHPTQLLERVQSFLATDQGRHILSSGSSYELSRITNWIISAGRSLGNGATNPRSSSTKPFVETLGIPKARRIYERTDQGDRRETTRNSERDSQRSVRRRVITPRAERPVRDALPRTYLPHENDGRGRRDSNSERLPRRSDNNPRKSRGTTSSRAARSFSRERNDQEQNGYTSTPKPSFRTSSNGSTSSRATIGSDKQWRFFLSRSNAVVDAPSIGPRMAERMAAVGIHTVANLLDGQAEAIAQRMDVKKVTAETVHEWQLQSALACRIPQLRGHDAQFLVAAGFETPEQLAASQPAAVLAAVKEVAHTAEGKRFLRGSAEPDLKEVTEWIEFARHSRTLAAA